MRSGMERNKQLFYYSAPTTGTDEYGNLTQSVYGNPVLARANISAASGKAEYQTFGVSEPYDRVINPLPKDFPLSASVRLWIDTLPVLDENGATVTPHDYKVVLPAFGLNHQFAAIRKVAVS